MGIYRENFTVRYSEVNYNNELTPINIMKYFQEIGCLHSDYVKMGLNQNATWIIIQWKVKILSTVKWNDKIMVRTWPSGMRGPYCLRDYEMYSGEKLIAKGTSKWVLIDNETNKVVKVTKNIMEKFGIVDNQVFGTPMEKLEPIEKASRTETHIVSHDDLDTNQHVNNIRYIEWAYNMLPERSKKVKYIEVMYKNAAVYKEKITCLYDNFQCTIKCGNKVSAIVKFKEI